MMASRSGSVRGGSLLSRIRRSILGSTSCHSAIVRNRGSGTPWPPRGDAPWQPPQRCAYTRPSGLSRSGIPLNIAHPAAHISANSPVTDCRVRWALRMPFPKPLAPLTITRALRAEFEAVGRRNMSQRQIWSRARFVPAGRFHRIAPAPASHQT